MIRKKPVACRVFAATDKLTMVTHQRIWMAVLLLTTIFASQIALGDETTEAESEDPLWEMRLAAFGRYGASYPASEDSQFNLVPLPYPVYRGKFFRLGEDSENPIRGRMFRRERVKLDFAFDLNFSVDSDDVDARTAMPDLDLLLEVGPELEIEFATPAAFNAKWFLGLQLRPAVSFDGLSPSFRGVIFSPELTWKKKLADRSQQFRIRVTPSLASSKYMDYYYTVDPAFATPTRPAYSAKGGYLGTNLSFSWVNNITEAFQFVTGARTSFHQGAKNKNSPLFTDDTTFSFYAAFTWKFWESERRATTID
jgi:outer membrane protein